MREPRIVARMWWCEDEVCDCTQPIIERSAPNPADPRFYVHQRLWEGEFMSGGAVEQDEGRWEARNQAFIAKAAEFGITLDENMSGWRPCKEGE